MLELGAEHSHIDCLSTGCLKLRPGLLDLNLGADSSSKPVLVYPQGLLILRDGGVQKLFLSIEASGLEVEQSQLRVHAQVHGCEVSRTCLRFGAIRRYVVAHSSPGVNLVGQFKRKLEVRGRLTIRNCS